MTRIGALNLGAALLALVFSSWLARPEARAGATAPRAPYDIAARVSEVVHEGGKPGLRDASGKFLALADFQRIVSTSGVTDSLLFALADSTRVVAVTRYSAENSPFRFRYQGKQTLQDISQVEVIVGLKPDLVLVNSLGPGDRIARLRAAGLKVFDLGEMRGMSTLVPNIVTVGTLLGRREFAQQFAARFERRMGAVAHAIPEAEQKRGMYLSVYGDSMYGGGPGTNYHDVIVAGGLRDAADPEFPMWPRFTPEQLLRLDPEVVVTQTGMGKALCVLPALDRLRVCSGHGRIAEVGEGLLDDPSLTMLDAAEAVYEAVYVAPDRARGAQ